MFKVDHDSNKSDIPISCYTYTVVFNYFCCLLFVKSRPWPFRCESKYVRYGYAIYSGAPNDQFVEKCIIIPQLMKIYVIKAFSVVFQYCWKKIICSFFPARHTTNFPARKIKFVWFPSQLQSEQPASRKTTIFHIVRQNGCGKRPQI